MDDKFLYSARSEPPAELAERLRRNLERQGPQAPGWRVAWKGLRLGPALASAAGVVAVVLLFTLPSVRASAQAFLDLFRVRKFAAVSVGAARMRQLEGGTIDLKGLIGDHLESLKEPGPPRVYPDLQSAGAAAGIPVRIPRTLPRGLSADTVYVHGEGEARLTVDLTKLREITRSLAIEDVDLPQSLDGARVTLHMPTVVDASYRTERRRVKLLQARSPEVTLPPGVDLARIGEAGLRIIGLSHDEAHRFAQSIDWNSTLLVPVPANASSFREVTVRGATALLITTTGELQGPDGRRRPGSILMWSEGDMVYALCGDLDEVSLLSMANSIE